MYNIRKLITKGFAKLINSNENKAVSGSNGKNFIEKFDADSEK